MRPQSRSLISAALTVPLGGLALVLLLAATTAPASAAQPPVGLGTADSFAVLAGSTVTNTGPSVISGDVGLSPGSSVTGFPPGNVINGTIHIADAVALQAQSDLTTAYNDAAGRTPAVIQSDPDVGGQTLVAGVYNTSSAMFLSGTVTLDAQGDPAAVFIFQAGSTLISASNSTVALVGGAQACHVYWQVGSSATIGVGTNFVGNVLALTSITMQTGATLQGSALARNGAVTLDTNVITNEGCIAPTSPPPTTATVAPTATSGPTSTATSTSTPTGPGSPGPTATGTGGGPGGPTPTTTEGGPGGPSGSGSPGGPNSPGGPESPGGPNSPGGPGTPPIPTGHPGTGNADAASSGANTWLFMGLLSLVGAAGAGILGRRKSAPSTQQRRA